MYIMSVYSTYRVEFVKKMCMWRFEDAIYDITHEVFQSVQQVLKGDKWTLPFYMSVPGVRHREMCHGKLAYGCIYAPPHPTPGYYR